MALPAVGLLRRHGEQTSSTGRHDLRLVPAAATVWLAGLTGLQVSWWCAAVVGVVAVVVAGLLLRVRRLPLVGTAGALLLAGGLVVCPLTLVLHGSSTDPLRDAATRGGAAVARVSLSDRPRPVRTTGYANQPGRGGAVVVEGQAATVRVDDTAVASTGRVLLVAPAEGWSELLPGQELTATGSLAPARTGELIAAVLQVRGPPRDVSPAAWWQTAAASVRASLRSACAVLDPEEAGLLPGLVVGDTGAMSRRVEEEFLDAGMSHLTAVSGANLVIVCGAVLLLVRMLRLGPRASAATAGAVLVGFVILVGYQPSVLRAGVMAAVGLLALYLGRAGSAVPALCFAVVLLVLLDPAMAVSIGFALSVVATGALVLLAPAWVEAMRRRGVPRGVAEALAVPLAAFVVTVPIIAGMAGEVGLTTVAANVLAAPVVAPATIFGFLAAVSAPLLPWLAEVLVQLAGPEVSWLVLVAREAAAVPGAVIAWPSGWWGGVLAAVACVGFVLLLRYPRGRVAVAVAVLGAGVVLVPATVLSPGWPPAGWTMVACDVGQGDGMAVATGEPGRAVVIDTGTELGQIDGCLDRLDVERVPLLVLSHLHADHIGGLAAVLDGRSVGSIAVGPGRAPHWAWSEVVQVARHYDVRVVEMTPGQRLRWPRLGLHVIGPRYVPRQAGEEDGTEINNSSLVIMASTPAGRILFTGDVELAAQADLLGSGEDLRADVLKVPHHGSRYTLPGFIAAVAPRVAVVSVGADNRYGHPNPGTMDLMQDAGVLVARTDTAGDAAILSDDAGLMVVREKARGPPVASVGQGGAHGVDRRRHGGLRPDLVLDGVQRLQAVAGDEQDDLGVRVELARLDELLRGRDGDPTRGLGEDALGAGQQPDALDDLVVGDVLDGATGAVDDVEHVRPVGGVADGQ
jgi:competence protein ComEC